MVEAARVIAAGGDAGCFEARDDVAGEGGVARCAVAHVEQGFRETKEIVDGVGLRSARDLYFLGFPMGRDRHDGARAAEGGAQ